MSAACGSKVGDDKEIKSPSGQVQVVTKKVKLPRLGKRKKYTSQVVGGLAPAPQLPAQKRAANKPRWDPSDPAQVKKVWFTFENRKQRQLDKELHSLDNRLKNINLHQSTPEQELEIQKQRQLDQELQSLDNRLKNIHLHQNQSTPGQQADSRACSLPSTSAEARAASRDDDDHLEYGGVGTEVGEEEYKRFLCTYDEYPQPMRGYGSRGYSSFIPPIPKRCPQTARAEEVKLETEEETRARIVQTLKQTKYFQQPDPELPGKEFWVNYICVSKQGYVNVTFNDPATEAQYARLKDNIKVFFARSDGLRNMTMPPDEIEKGRFVIAKWEDKVYIRALVLDVNLKAGTVEVRDWDEWRAKTVTVQDIFYMLPGFMNIPFKIQKCKLKGLELWAGTQTLYEMKGLLKEFRSLLMRASDCTIDGEDKLPVVTLQICDDPTKDITLNALLKYVLSGFTRIPKQFLKGMILEGAHLSVGANDGELWIQMHSYLAGKLSSLGENPKECSTYIPKYQDPIKEFEGLYFDSLQTRFLARFKNDRAFYRVKVLEATRGAKEVKVQYLDFGNTEIIDVEDIIPIQSVDPVLEKTPMQVFRGYFNGIDEVLDWDGIFDEIGATTIQRFVVAGFREPNVPLLDAYAKLNSGNNDEWTFVNQFIIEKGFAKGPGVSNPSPCGTPKRKIRSSSSPGPSKKKVAFETLQERKRYYSSCRVSAERTGLLGAFVKNQH